MASAFLGTDVGDAFLAVRRVTGQNLREEERVSILDVDLQQSVLRRSEEMVGDADDLDQ